MPSTRKLADANLMIDRLVEAYESLEPILDELFGLVTTDAPKAVVVAKLQALDTRHGLGLHLLNYLDETLVVADKPARKAPSHSALYARALLKNAMSRIEQGGDLAIEARAFVPFVRAGSIDGRLVRAALVDAAKVAGMSDADIDRVLFALARAEVA